MNSLEASLLKSIAKESWTLFNTCSDLGNRQERILVIEKLTENLAKAIEWGSICGDDCMEIVLRGK